MSDHEGSVGEAEQRIGSVLRGKYHIDAVLGVGGMAVVYAATHRNKKRFAVKILHEELSVRRDLRARFLREGYVANSVDHPGVVTILDDDVDESGAAFLVMELLEGASVETLCTRARTGLPVREALDITRQLLDVLDVAHAKTIIHRDIKPANLFVLKDGRVKVLDFGIARLRDVTVGVQSTRDGAVLGTPAFMAPEQALAQGSDVDPRTDVWAAGATLFTMLSGQFVHEGDNGRQMLIRAATVPARSLATVAPCTPEAIVNVVDRALAFERSARWETAAAMREAIARVHDELFGAPAPSHLAALVEAGACVSSDAPTQPADAAGASATGLDAAPVPASPAVGRSEVATTTAKPVSNGKSEGARRLGGPVSAIAGAAAVIALGGGLAILRSHGSAAGPSHAGATPSTLAPLTVLSPALSAAASDPLPPADRPAVSAPVQSTSDPVVETPHRTPPASPPTKGASPAAPSTAVRSAAPSAAKSATATDPASAAFKRDRLHIELQ